MKTYLNVNGHGKKLIERFERERMELPPYLLGYRKADNAWNRFRNKITMLVFQWKVKKWARSVIKAQEHCLNSDEKCTIKTPHND